MTPFASGSFAALRVERASRSRSARDIARGLERSGNGSWRSGSYVPSRESSAAEMRFSATRHQGEKRIFIQDERDGLDGRRSWWHGCAGLYLRVLPE